MNQAVLGLGSGEGLGLRDWKSYSPHQALNPKPSPNLEGSKDSNNRLLGSKYYDVFGP